MKKWMIPCGWKNRAGIGEPLDIIVTCWREPTPDERKAKRQGTLL